MIMTSLIDHSFTLHVLAAKVRETLGGGKHEEQ
jgi:hypothetical protein